MLLRAQLQYFLNGIFISNGIVFFCWVVDIIGDDLCCSFYWLIFICSSYALHLFFSRLYSLIREFLIDTTSQFVCSLRINPRISYFYSPQKKPISKSKDIPFFSQFINLSLSLFVTYLRSVCFVFFSILNLEISNGLDFTSTFISMSSSYPKKLMLE